jgi:hypothetical protein
MTTYDIYFRTASGDSRIKHNVKEADVIESLLGIRDRYEGCFVEQVIDYYGNDFEA